MSTLTLDPADPAISEATKGCKVGDEKSFTVTGKVTSVGEMIEMDVTSAEYAEPDVEEVEEEADEPVVSAMKPGKSSGKAGNPGLMLLIGKAK